MSIVNPSIQYPLFQNMEYNPNPVDRMILRNGIRFYVGHCFYIPEPVVSKYFSYYKLLYWSGTHIIESIEAGMIVRDNIAFRVVYAKGLTRGFILKNKTDQYKLSFRAALSDWNIDPIVIIQSIEE